MKTPLLPETKVTDIFLMDAFASAGYKNSKLTSLNVCRKYLQVITLGDITTADGSLILPSIKAGRQMTTSTSNLLWPHQPHPDEVSWRLWRAALRKTFESNGRIHLHLMNRCWTNTPHRTFHWYYDDSAHSLFHRLPDQRWQLYRLSVRRGRQPSSRIFHRTPTLVLRPPSSVTTTPVIPLAPHRVKLGNI